MSASIADVLNAQGKLAVQSLQGAVAKVDATTKTKRSIRYESDDSKLTLFGREFIDLLNKGRGPTTKGPSREMIENLTEYAQARGMDKPESAAWAMAKILNAKGDKAFRKGGRDVYESELQKVIDRIEAAVVLFKMNEAKDKIKESLKDVK